MASVRGPVRAAVSRLPLRGAADREGALVRDVADGPEIPQVYRCANLGGGIVYVPIGQALVEKIVLRFAR